MRNRNGILHFSATDLAGHLSCNHLTQLDVEAARGKRTTPESWNPLLEILRKRGELHEQGYLNHLEENGHEILQIEGSGLDKNHAEETLAAMQSGATIISQGVLLHGRWGGRADILKRIDQPSKLGDWSYEVIDAKLARETKGASVLQLCLYAELLSKIQGLVPEFIYVVTPRSDFELQQFRSSDYLAYYRFVKQSLEAAVANHSESQTYPDPKQHCDVCRWRRICDTRRRDDDHLCLVAGMSRLQINELRGRDIDTVQSLATEPLPLTWRPERGAVQTYERLREQARVQVSARESGKTVYESLEPTSGRGLERLPTPSAGDVFFDLEGDPYVGEGGLEYLFGYVAFDDHDTVQYTARWALDYEEEKLAFEEFVDQVVTRWKRYPDMHVYHFAPYEPSALKRLMGRYATREEEIDQMLRAGLLVDLHRVVRESIRASVESYSLKELEQFHGFDRNVTLPDANQALAQIQAYLEFDDVEGLSEESKNAVQGYNQDDCLSTLSLREWLENVRNGLIDNGTQIERPAAKESDPSEAISAWQERVNALVEHLSGDVPAAREGRTDEQQARWLLANIADWHRREEKSVWWEYFRLRDLSADDLIDERNALANLEFLGTVGGTARAPVHRYRFPAQETDLRDGKELRSVGGDPFGKLETISFKNWTADIKKRMDSVGRHPSAVFSHDHVNANVLKNSLVGIGEYVAANGIEGNGANRAALDLLLRQRPRVGGAPLQCEGETTAEAAVRIAPLLEGGVLPIQGPPGAGKTFTGARMICALVASGAKIGITANSHKVIRNLLDEVVKAAEENGTDLTAIQKPAEMEEDLNRLRFTTGNEDVFRALQMDCQVAGGTAWLWARPEARNAVDVLFVDEAAQMSLANVLAVSSAAAGLVLIGDPQQLDQPMQGSHPDGTAVSALDHLLDGQQTIGTDRGLFLEQTWRLHPDICAFTSEMFYEGRLSSRPGLENQRIVSTGPVQGSGLRFLEVAHTGNQSSSPEEVDMVCTFVESLVGEGAKWIDKDGDENLLHLEDILIIAPYNKQVFELQDRLPDARIGTVDKFQGQEAPLVIYSMATSTPSDAPHGMEFLYSLNRLNVATSRARCVCLLVANPNLFEPECRTPQQMRLANAFCRYRELAEDISL